VLYLAEKMAAIATFGSNCSTELNFALSAVMLKMTN